MREKMIWTMRLFWFEGKKLEKNWKKREKSEKTDSTKKIPILFKNVGVMIPKKFHSNLVLFSDLKSNFTSI